MYKKLLVFSLAFCLGLISSGINKRFNTNSVIEDNKPINLESSVKPVIKLQKFNSFNFPESNSTPIIEKNNSRFRNAGVENDNEVKDLYLTFQRAVAKEEKKIVASLMKYPLRVNFPDDTPTENYTFIKNQKMFLKNYDRIFNDRFKRFIAKIDVEKDTEADEDIWARYDGIAVGRGVIWIGVYCYKNYCTDKKYYIKFRTLHAHSNLMDLE